MRTVAALGYFGHGNFGDELMLEGLRQLFKGYRVIPLSYDTFSFDAVNDCDLFVLGGGEVIYEDRLFMPSPCIFNFENHSLGYRLYARSFLAHMPWLHRIKVPKLLLGCGVDVENASQLKPNVVKDLAEFDFIGLRDDASVQILSDIPGLKEKTCLFYDLSFALDIKAEAKGGEAYSVVIPTDRETLKVAELSACWLHEKLEPNGKTLFLPFGREDNNDYVTCCKLASEIDNSEVLCQNMLSLDLITELLANCSTAYAYRLHGMLLAYMIGANYRFYPYHRKLNRVHKTIAETEPETIRQIQREIFKEVVS